VWLRGNPAASLPRMVAWAAGRDTASRYVLAEWPVLSQPTLSAEDRFLALSARSYDRSGTRAKGRYDPFAKPSANGRCLRSPAGWSRR
jgi:hypothetical protein